MKASTLAQLKVLLDDRVALYNQPVFIESDPISVPHQYTRLQDIEIVALWTAVFSWGLRKTIINKANELFALMDHAPYDFVMHHSDEEAKRLLQFVHRTFQPTDTLYFLHFFRNYYSENDSLQSAFTRHTDVASPSVKEMLTGFHRIFFDSEWAPKRTRKHIATPARGASCKRLNMFLRWMVRRDASGVDLGLWHDISTADLMIPLDVHVMRVAHRLGLLTRDKSDWKAVEELTSQLRLMDPKDPVKYDYALFGMGVMEP
ncbi:MAG: TIGR02757 family protein [Bacteroidetes bacterium]|nr:MAG: TIGR02757 family protein [Bacteroidota bacterium]